MYILACGMPDEITGTIGKVYNLLLVAIPIIIVVFGLLDFVKAVMGKKDDEIKQSTGIFIKRLITGLIAFFILALVKFGIGLIQTGNTSEAIDCLDSILGN